LRRGGEFSAGASGSSSPADLAGLLEERVVEIAAAREDPSLGAEAKLDGRPDNEDPDAERG